MPMIGWILFGLLIGVAAKFSMGGRDVAGYLVSVALGVVGAVAGGLLGRGIGWDGLGTSAEVVMAIAGSLVPLVAYGLWTRRAAGA